MQKQAARIASLIAFSLFTTGALSSCTSKKDPSDTSGANTLRTHFGDDIKTLDPANAYDELSLDVVGSIYESLYQYAYLKDPYELEPLLAESMPKLSEDKLTLTIPIKKGIHFHDDPAFPQGKGRELKAQDFIFQIKRLALPSLKSNGWWSVDGKIKGLSEFHKKLTELETPVEIARTFNEPVSGLKALDDHTLQIQLTEPYPQLLYVLAMPFTAAVAREAVEKYADKEGNLSRHAVGTGPFRLKDWQPGSRISLIKNPAYRTSRYPESASEKFRKEGLLADAGKALPLLDAVDIRIIKESQPAWLSFISGKLDLIGIPKDNFDEVILNRVDLAPDLREKGVHLKIHPGNSFWFIAFNMQDDVLGKNKLLRQAISAAIDREKWIDLFTNGRGTKATAALPPGISGRPENAKLKYDYDLARAKKLLEKAGYPGGKGLPPIRFDLRGASSLSRQMGDFFESELGKAGIKIQVVMNTFPAYLQKAKEGNLQMFLGGWIMDYPDAENVYQLLYGPNRPPGANDTSFDHPRMNALYTQMARMEPSPKRSKIISEMDAILQEEVPWALGYYTTGYGLFQPWLKNYRSADLILNRWKYLKIEGRR